MANSDDELYKAEADMLGLWEEKRVLAQEVKAQWEEMLKLKEERDVLDAQIEEFKELQWEFDGDKSPVSTSYATGLILSPTLMSVSTLLPSMATENCNSAVDVPVSTLVPPCSSSKRCLIGSEAKPCPSINKLGGDLLVEILIRSFPNPKLACRCKLVCKQWNSLISDPCFNRRYVSHHQSINGGEGEPPLMFSYSRDHVFRFLPVPDEVSRRWYFRFLVFDSFKDLILCGLEELIGSAGSLFSGELVRSFFVCNPFTEQWVALPLAPEKPIGSTKSVTRLVCEPRSSSSCNLDLGNGKTFLYSDYRFRVVCLYQHMTSIKLDVFCSESGKWTKEALVLDDHQLVHKNVISCNGELFWCCRCSNTGRVVLFGLNPFHLDVPPARFRISERLLGWQWNISVSQGTCYLVVLKGVAFPAVLHVLRLKDDRRTWMKQHEWWLLKTTSTSRCNYEVKNCTVLGLHPGKPEMVFLLHRGLNGPNILFFNLRSRELGFFDNPQPTWMVFQPKIYCWPTPIPGYEKLRGMYDGSYNCWVQHSSKATTCSLPQHDW
ncbi:unnamed protein product [Linum trigynum]|uniref:F-box protein At3g26010-like beta-propeller domain-containing protein n=1 Tax=Linum trigynum TaxID=586398 RepID=A0AAV2GG66_9ROSI